MKFLLVADLHLGYRQYGMERREQDFYDALEQVAKLAIDNCVDVVVAGDLFDTTKPPAKAVLRMQMFVERLKNHGLNVYGVEGNHDITKDNYWLRVCGVVPLDGGVVDIRGAKFTGFNYGKGEDILPRIKELGKVDVVVTHAGFVEMQGDFASEFSTEEFSQALAHTGCKVVANGHIHMWGNVQSGGVTFVQPGSLEVKALDEPHFKQAALVSLEDGKVDVTRLQYPTRKFVIKQIDSEEQFQLWLNGLDELVGTMLILYVNRDIEDASDRFLKALGDREILWRFIPTEGKVEMEERKTVSSLAEAIEAYFEPGSPEYVLITRCLQTPANASNIALDYINDKEEEKEVA